MDRQKTRVLVVDDSFFMRKVIGDFLRSDPAITVVGEAADGQEALERIAELHPQVVTLDIEMPNMDGLEALRAIVSSPQHPSVLMVSGYAQKGADLTLECLKIGAADFISKPSGSFSLDMDEIRELLIQKVKLAAEIDTAKMHDVSQPPPTTWRYQQSGGVVVIGASTGGPAALEVLLPAFPESFPYPIAVAQHLPPEFSMSFAARLDKRCRLRVVCAEHNVRIAPGNVYIAAGSTNTTLALINNQPTLVVKTDLAGFETPSVDSLMASAASVYGDKTIGIILTGMGRDGVEGMRHIKQVGGSTIVQDRSTSAIFGMPSEVIDHGLADAVVPLDNIMQKVSELLM